VIAISGNLTHARIGFTAGCSSGEFAAVSLLSGTRGTPDSQARFQRRPAVLGMPKLSAVQGDSGRRVRRTTRPFTSRGARFQEGRVSLFAFANDNMRALRTGHALRICDFK
jgi:hypothetical protein